jgi:hypothetical protein
MSLRLRVCQEWNLAREILTITSLKIISSSRLTSIMMYHSSNNNKMHIILNEREGDPDKCIG